MMKNCTECNDCIANKLYNFVKEENCFIKTDNGKTLSYDEAYEVWVIKKNHVIMFKTEFLDLALGELKGV